MRRISMSKEQHCFNCWKIIQKNEQALKHECVTTNPTTDVITIELHIMCKSCIYLFKSIKSYAQKYKLSYANHKFKLETIIDKSIIKLSGLKQQDNQKSKYFQFPIQQHQNGQLKSKSQEKKLTSQIPQSNKQQIYRMILEQTLIQNKLNYAFWLPKSLQYLIYLTSKNMRPEQRHQRIKKLIFLVSNVYSVQIKELKVLIIFLQTLICHMDQNLLAGIVDRILKIYIRNYIPFQLLIHSFKIQNGSQKNKSQNDKIQNKQIQVNQKNQKEIWKRFRPDLLIYISLSVIILSDFIKQKKLIKEIEEVQQISIKSLQLNISEKATQNEIQNYIKQHAKENQKTGKINDQGWGELLQLRKFQNNYFLILQTVKNQQQANYQYISQIELKFKKQKEQYINKIIRLNSKIEQLSIQLEKYKQKEQSSQQNKLKFIEDKKFNQKTNKSNPQVNHIINKQEIPQLLINRINHSISTSNLQMQTQIQQKSLKTTKSMVTETYQEEKSFNLINNLQSILTITDIIQINKKYDGTKNLPTSTIVEFPTNPDDLSSLIISQITKMEKNLMKLKNQGKKSKEQTNRIMSILKRKQQQWLPLFHQKDELISKYQDALLKLQNGKITQIEPLASRIKYIASKWSTCSKCSQIALYNDSQQRNSKVDDNRSSCVQDRSSFIQINGQKQKKKKEKDCVIY